jgi:transposase
MSPVKDLFGVQGRAYVDEIMAEIRPTAQRVVNDHLTLIDHLDQQVAALEADLTLSEADEQVVKLLKSMPGVGRITAIVILAEIGDIRRFDTPKALCHWAGLTPRVRKSDQVVRHGRITKQGSPYLRAALTRAATVASRTSKRWYHVHEKMLPRCGRTGAKVAVARRLLTVIFFMLTRHEPYLENYPTDR